jgi:hypothetical protein
MIFWLKPKKSLSISPGHANDQTHGQAPEGAGLVAPGPEHGQEIDGADGRRQVAGDALDVGEKLGSLR